MRNSCMEWKIEEGLVSVLALYFMTMMMFVPLFGMIFVVLSIFGENDRI